jgi:hypothetical protein
MAVKVEGVIAATASSKAVQDQVICTLSTIKL